MILKRNKRRWLSVCFGLCLMITSAQADSVVVFNEIMYHPAEQESELEWVELHNQLAVKIDLSGWSIQGGIDYTFPEGTVIDAEGYKVVAIALVPFIIETGYVQVLGPFTGRLANSGETLRLLNNSDRIMDQMSYLDQGDWPVAPDGSGVSLAKFNEDQTGTLAKNWTWSEQITGTPGRTNFPDGPVQRPVTFNEISSATAPSFWIELVNQTQNTIDLTGYVLSGSNGPEESYIISETTLAPQAHLILEENDLGFRLQDGDILYLYTADQQSVMDAVVIKNLNLAKTDKGQWLEPTLVTPGTDNHFELHDEIVINEIMYHPPPIRDQAGNPEANNDITWIELFNRSDHEVDLSGWQLTEAIAFTFATGTTLLPGDYLVVTSDANSLLEYYPDRRIVGNFNRQLSRKGERILLLDALGYPADEVFYYDQGYWPAYADGGGSSLELRDPNADNANAQAWAASDEATQASWTTVQYQGQAAQYPGSNYPTTWNEFVFGLLDAGEFLIDDISVIEDPRGLHLELIQNGSFDNGPQSYRFLGNHQFGEIVPDPEDPSNSVLHVTASGALQHNHNHIETTLEDNRPIVDGRDYLISFRARWRGGSNQLNSRLYFNRLARTTPLNMPTLTGSPGLRNTQYQANIGPTFNALIHSPVVPAPGEDIAVTVQLDDPDGVLLVALKWSFDGSFYQIIPMESIGQSRYQAVIPGQAAGTRIQFHVKAYDNKGITSFAPPAGPESCAMFQVDDGKARGGLSHDIRVLIPAADVAWQHEEVNLLSNHRIGATIIYKERDVYYDVGVRLKGSGYGRQILRSGYNLRFRPDHLFQGIHDVISIDRNLAVSGRHRELVFKHIGNHAGALPSVYDDMAYMIAPLEQLDGPAQLFLARFDDEYLDSVYTNGSSSELFELEIIYYSNRTIDGDPESLKPRPNTVLDTDFGDMSNDKEAYRWNYLIKNHRAQDDYSHIMDMAQTFSLNGDTFSERIPNVIDVDQWMRFFAYQSLGGVGDTYNQSHPHNLKLYVRPSDHRIVCLPWDTDRAFSNSPTDSIYGSSGSRLQKVLNLTKYRRRFLWHLYDIMNTTFHLDYMEDWVRYYADIAGTNATNTILSRIKDRRDYALSQLPEQVPFAVTTNNGEDYIVSIDEGVTLEGTGWLDVAEIRFSGQADALDIQWNTLTTWSVSIPLAPGVNPLVLEAYDQHNQLLGSDSITITR